MLTKQNIWIFWGSILTVLTFLSCTDSLAPSYDEGNYPVLTVYDYDHSQAGDTDRLVSFGSVSLSSSQTQTVEIVNSGYGRGDLIISEINSLKLTEPFSINTGSCEPVTTFLPGRSCTLTVTFVPITAGTYTSSFDIISNDRYDSSITVTVEGIGTN